MGLILRLFDIQTRGFWFDEAVSYLIAGAGAMDTIHAADAEKLPPLYNLILHFYLKLFHGEAAARMLSALAGFLTLPVFYVIVRKLADKRTALVAMTLLALCPFHIWYSQEIRVYAIQTFLACLSTLAMVLLLDRGGRRQVAFYGISTAFLLLAHYTSAFVVLFQNVFFLVLWKENRGALKLWCIAQAVALLLFSPWLPYFWSHLTARSGEFWLDPFKPGALLSHLMNFTGGIQTYTSWNEALAWAGVVIVIGCMALALVSGTLRRAGTMALLWFLVPTVVLALVSIGTNIFLSRSLLYTLPAFCLLVALAFSCLWERPWTRPAGLLLAVLLVTGYGYGLYHYYQDSNWWIRPPHKDNAQRLGRICGESDLIVHTSRFTYRPYQIYLKDRCNSVLLHETEDMPGLFAAIGSSTPEAESVYRDVDRVFLVAWEDFQTPRLSGQVVDWYTVHHQKSKTYYEDSREIVAGFLRMNAPAIPQIRFGGGD